MLRPSLTVGAEVMMMMMSTLTFTDEEVGECEDDRVTAVQEITTHHVRARDGQTSSWDKL